MSAVAMYEQAKANTEQYFVVEEVLEAFDYPEYEIAYNHFQMVIYDSLPDYFDRWDIIEAFKKQQRFCYPELTIPE
jgi:hypothetical protein